MNKPLYLFVGKSASGKTTISETLERTYGLNTLSSYTTRSPRYDGETGHVFISNEEFDALEELVAYTEYNGHRYGCTKAQVDAVSIYVIDVPGVETLLQKYNTDRPIVIIYFDASIRTRIDRMIDRHDSDMAIVARIYNDESSDWEQDLHKLIWHYNNNLGKHIEMHKVDANWHADNVIGQVLDLIGNNMEVRL